MAYQAVLYEKSDHVATITLNRPEALNAFSTQLRTDLFDALKESEADSDVRCVIITGAGRAFSAGADVKRWDQNIEQNAEAAEPPSTLVLPRGPDEGMGTYIMAMTKPVIAAINGVAVGMGATLPLTCDLRTISESGRFGFIFARRGLTPEYGSSFLLPRLVGYGKARELCMTGRFVGGKEAAEIGLAEAVFPADQLMSGTMELAQSIAANPPIPIRFIKRMLNVSLDSTLRDMLEIERWAFATCQQSDDYKEAIRAFVEKRSPTFTGR